MGLDAFIRVRYESGQFGGITAFGLPISQYTLNIFDMSLTRHEQFVTMTPSSLTLNFEDYEDKNGVNKL